MTVPKTNIFGSRAFTYSAVKFWNSLPDHVLSEKSLYGFKKALKTHFKLAHLNFLNNLCKLCKAGQRLIDFNLTLYIKKLIIIVIDDYSNIWPNNNNIQLDNVIQYNYSAAT